MQLDQTELSRPRQVDICVKEEEYISSTVAVEATQHVARVEDNMRNSGQIR